MALVGQVKQFMAEDIIVIENEKSRKMYIIKEGKARVFRTYLDHKITLAILGPGEIFGELSFFDAEPRSASVEALGALKVVEMDGADMTKETENLPKWFFPVLKTVFTRFREADRKVTVLESVLEFKKKSFKEDDFSKTLYLEVGRLLKLFKILLEKKSSEQKTCAPEAFLKELDSLSGKKVLSLNVFWKTLAIAEIIDPKKASAGIVGLNEENVRNLEWYLDNEISTETFTLLSHSSIAILRKILSILPKGQDPLEHCEWTVPELKLENVPLSAEALEELYKKGVLTRAGPKVSADISKIIRIYQNQTFLKSFDHSQVNVE